MRKFVALYDIHYGHEWRKKNGKDTLCTTHNVKALNSALEFIEDFKPDTIILGGDQLDCGCISHWNADKPLYREKLRLKTELDGFYSNVLVPLQESSCSELVWLKGNHEVWIDQFIEKHPQLQGMLEPETYFSLRDVGWEVKEQGEFFKLGKLHFVHGDVILNGRTTVVNPAKYLVDQTRVSIRAGHIHTYYAYTDINGLDSSDYHTGVTIPCLSNLNPTFLKNKPTRIVNGFNYGYVYPNGNFNDFVVIINNGKFVVDGKMYGS